MQSSSAGIRELFHAHDLRCTRQRELVYSALAASAAHPTAEELFRVVRGDDAGLSLATVYNTLEAFTRSGLCRKIACSTGAGPCRYDACTHEHVHVATPDGRVMDLPGDLSARILGSVTPEVRREIEQRLGVRVGRVTVKLFAAGEEHSNAEAAESAEGRGEAVGG